MKPLEAATRATPPPTGASGMEAAPIDVRPFEAAHDAAWDRFVRAHPDGTFFHLAGWRRAVVRAFRHEARDLVAWRRGEIVGVLPLMSCRGPLSGAHLISTPYGVYGGPLGVDRETNRELVDAAARMAERDGVGRLELRCLVDPGLDLLASDRYATFIHTLPADPAEVMKRMPKRARAEVRKAIEKHGLTLAEGPEHLSALVELFHASKQHLGSPGLPRAWFQALLDEFPGEAIVHVAQHAGTTVAATMSFVYGDTFLFYYIGTSADGNRTYNATNYLCTRFQEMSIERGLKRFDLGRSRTDSGSFSFKVHQGFEPTPLAYRYKLVKSAGLPSFTPSNPRTKLLRETWAKLPPWITRRVSDRLARYLP